MSEPLKWHQIVVLQTVPPRWVNYQERRVVQDAHGLVQSSTSQIMRLLSRRGLIQERVLDGKWYWKRTEEGTQALIDWSREAGKESSK